MKKEIRIFFTALMFLTRLPVPHFTDHAPEYLEKASKYFPLIGWIVGAISAAVFLLCSLFLTTELSILASMVAGILATGAFHEDGFADVCDAFGGGWTKEKILEIMKDSRLGTFGTIGLIFILGAKFLLLQQLAQTLVHHTEQNIYIIFTAGLLAAHAASRLMAVGTIQFSTYVFSDAPSKSKPLASHKLSAVSSFIAVLFAVLPFLFLPLLLLILFPIIIVATFLLHRYFKKWIGGYTGDCLGTIQQIAEIICYLTMCILWNYI